MISSSIRAAAARSFDVAALVPRRNKGLIWRHALKARDPEQIVDCTHALLATTSSFDVTTLREIYSRYDQSCDAIEEPRLAGLASP